MINNGEEFNGLDKDRGSSELRRFNRYRKISSRKRKLREVFRSYNKSGNSINSCSTGERYNEGNSMSPDCFADHHIWYDNRLSNNNEMNRQFGHGTRRKVNRRKSHVTYRCKLGDYGRSKEWPRNAQVQIDEFEDQLKEYVNG